MVNARNGGRLRGHARPGFTLVEACVVLGIIGFCLALALPALARSGDAATRASCAANLRQWGSALRVYASDNAEAFPYNGGPRPARGITGHGMGYWWNTSVVRDFVHEYLDFEMTPDSLATYENITNCPTGGWQDTNPPAALYEQVGLGYVYLPSRTESALTIHTPEGWLTKTRFHGEYADAPVMVDYNQQNTTGDGEPQWTAGGVQPLSAHAGPDGRPLGSNFLFEDVSVRWYDREEIEVGAEAWGDWVAYWKISIPASIDRD